MTKSPRAIIGVLAGCPAEPRSAEYVQGHPAEAALVITDCQVGRNRGRECETAQAANAAADADRRLELFAGASPDGR